MINLHESTGPGWDSISRPLDSDSHLLPDTLPTAQTVILNSTEFVWWLTCTSGWAGALLFFAFGSPLHGPQRVCIFWLNCSLFLNCWVELNQICAQLKQIVYTRAYFWVPHSEAPYNGVKSVCPFFFYANPNRLGWIQPNLLKDRLSHKWGVVKNIYFFYPPAKFSIIRNYWVIRRLRTVLTFFSIIYCNKTTYYSNFDYPKNSIFRSDLSVPIKEMAIKLPFKIWSPNVTHGDHDFFVWSSLFLLYRLIIRKK